MVRIGAYCFLFFAFTPEDKVEADHDEDRSNEPENRIETRGLDDKNWLSRYQFKCFLCAQLTYLHLIKTCNHFFSSMFYLFINILIHFLPSRVQLVTKNNGSHDGHCNCLNRLKDGNKEWASPINAPNLK